MAAFPLSNQFSVGAQFQPGRERWCSGCKEYKPVTEFHKDGRGGLHRRCGKCIGGYKIKARRGYYPCRMVCSFTEFEYVQTVGGIDNFKRASCSNYCCRENLHAEGDQTHFCLYHRDKVFVPAKGRRTRMRNSGIGTPNFDRIDEHGKPYDGPVEVHFTVTGVVRRTI